MLRSRLPSAAATAVLAAVVVVPTAFAQPAPATPPTPNIGSTAAPVELGRPQRTHGGWRSSRIIGATVYNDRDERIGTVDDLIVGQDGRISLAVLSIGGFLHVGAKLVAVPYDQLRFEEQTEGQAADVDAPPVARVGTPASPGAPATVTAPPARPVVTTRIVLPGATRETLTAHPGFNYRDRD
jgi:PRC-barrel domain